MKSHPIETGSCLGAPVLFYALLGATIGPGSNPRTTRTPSLRLEEILDRLRADGLS